jgi:hypothetical protein
MLLFVLLLICRRLAIGRHCLLCALQRRGHRRICRGHSSLRGILRDTVTDLVNNGNGTRSRGLQRDLIQRSQEGLESRHNARVGIGRRGLCAGKKRVGDLGRAVVRVEQRELGFEDVACVADIVTA